MFIDSPGKDYYDVSGDVELYGCAYSKLADEVAADGQCVIWSDPQQVINVTKQQIDISGMNNDDVSLGMVANILPEYRSQGYTTAVEDGEVVYSDGENIYKTGISAVFDEEAYAHDIIGTERERAFGCCSDVTLIPQKAIMGDVNEDGSIDILDVVMVQKYSVDLIELDELQLYVSDVNDDGVVDTLDAVMIQQYTVEKIIDFYKW